MEETPVAETPVPQPEPVLKKPRFNILKILVILVPLLILLLGGAYYLSVRKNSNVSAPTPTSQAVQTPNATQSPEANANIKTYTNTKYGYSFSYPSDWEVLGTATDATFGLAPKGDKEAVISVDVANMVFDDRGVIPFAEYAKVAAKNEIQGYTSLDSINKVTTNSGAVGYQTTWKVAPPPGVGGGTVSVSNPMTYFPLSTKYGTGLLSKRLQISGVSNYAKYSSVYQALILTVSFSN